MAGYFLDAVIEHGGCPRIVRGDAGTENVHVQRIQEQLMSVRPGGASGSYIKAKSTSNQRIEAFWGQLLRKQSMIHWIDLFKTLEDAGYFLGDFVDKNLMQFTFMSLIQVGKFNL